MTCTNLQTLSESLVPVAPAKTIANASPKIPHETLNTVATVTSQASVA